MATDRPNTEPFRLLFVCTGNTCRSPLAEALARTRVRELGWDHVEVASAGVAAAVGEPASGGSLRAASRHGLDLAEHRASALTTEALEQADLVLVMSPGHLGRLQGLGAGEKVSLLTDFAAAVDPQGVPDAVPDPFGGPDEAYEATYVLLERLVERALKRLAPIVAP
jgi:protein-tyrosine-phosphatase